MERHPRLYGVDGAFRGYLSAVADLLVDETLDGESTLSFSMPADARHAEHVGEDAAIRYEGRRYIVTKALRRKDPAHRLAVTAEGASIELLWRVRPGTFELLTVSAADGLEAILDGTNWTVGDVEDDDTERTMSEVNQTDLWLVRSWARICGLEVEFDTDARVVHLRQERGEDRGVSFRWAKNLKEVQREVYPPEATRIWPFGRNGLTIGPFNPLGQDYLEDFSWYTSQGIPLAEARQSYLKEYILTDDRFLEGVALMDYAQRRLAQMAQPRVAYQVGVIDLQGLTGVDESYALGDTVHVYDPDIADVRARVVSYRRRPKEPWKNEVELSYQVPGLETLAEDESLSDTVGMLGDQLLYDSNASALVVGGGSVLLADISVTAYSFTNATGGLSITGTATAAGTLTVDVMLGAAVYRSWAVQVPAAGLFGFGIPFVILNLPAGTQSVRLRMSASAGTFSLAANGAELWIEARNLSGGAGSGAADETVFEDVDTDPMPVGEAVSVAFLTPLAVGATEGVDTEPDPVTETVTTTLVP